jgi:hypothetical protein
LVRLRLSGSRNVKTPFRAAVTFVAGVATYYVVYWFGGAALSLANASPWISLLAAVLAAMAVARYVWLHTASVERSLVSSTIVGALITGGVAFCVGFFGAIVVMPDANLGPLLGMVVAVPLGLLAGAIGGAARWFMRRRPPGRRDDAA